MTCGGMALGVFLTLPPSVYTPKGLRTVAPPTDVFCVLEGRICAELFWGVGEFLRALAVRPPQRPCTVREAIVRVREAIVLWPTGIPAPGASGPSGLYI